jgi:serine/threonine protein kinase
MYGVIRMSPEAIVKQQYSEKSDAFSFGVCLWEILFRQQPYPGFHDLEAALKVLSLLYYCTRC